MCDFGCFVTAVIWPVIAKLENDLKYGKSVKLLVTHSRCKTVVRRIYGVVYVVYVLVYFALTGVVLTLCSWHGRIAVGRASWNAGMKCTLYSLA